MQQYLDLIKIVMEKGEIKKDRTGTGTIGIPGAFLQFDLREGYPILTTKRVAFKTMKTELDGFIKGISNKSWYSNQGCHIWDDWGNPKKVPYGTDEKSKENMRLENDLGRIYGVQWRDWAGHIDQLKEAIETLRKNPTDRRMLVIAWNPEELDQMALPPCHFAFKLMSNGTHLDLSWHQRSCDLFLGIPFNIASYALLCHLIAKEVNLIPRFLCGHLDDVHIYLNHQNAVAEQLTRTPKSLPILKIEDRTNWSIFDWESSDTSLEGYDPYPTIKGEISV
jgi:thymidylate synthase